MNTKAEICLVYYTSEGAYVQKWGSGMLQFENGVRDRDHDHGSVGTILITHQVAHKTDVFH